MVREILLLGDERLLRPSREVRGGDLDAIRSLGDDLRDTLLAFRRKHGVGRGIAAPQVGTHLRVVYLHWPEPRLLVNPELDRFSEATFELWDDCMSFPELLVRVRRHVSCRLRYLDPSWQPHEERVEGALSELLQHEVDHLDGVLAVSRAVHPQAMALRREMERQDRTATRVEA